MNITKQLATDLGGALNEASLAGVEYVPERNSAGITFVCLTLPEDGPEPHDTRRLFVLENIGRIAASLRHGKWDDKTAPVESFGISDLLKVVQSFESQPVYGWEFFNTHLKELKQWGDRLSLDFSPQGGSQKNSICMFQEYGDERHLDLCVWFDSFTIFDSDGNQIKVEKFIEDGARWWEAMHSGDPRIRNHGIQPLE